MPRDYANAIVEKCGNRWWCLVAALRIGFYANVDH